MPTACNIAHHNETRRGPQAAVHRLWCAAKLPPRICRNASPRTGGLRVEIAKGRQIAFANVGQNPVEVGQPDIEPAVLSYVVEMSSSLDGRAEIHVLGSPHGLVNPPIESTPDLVKPTMQLVEMWSTLPEPSISKLEPPKNRPQPLAECPNRHEPPNMSEILQEMAES